MDDYDVTPCAVGALSGKELKTCIDLVIAGKAVSATAAKRDFPQARVVAIARDGDGKIVGVGAIKPVRIGYASGIAKKSGVAFDPATPEFGYVVVHPDHQNRGVSKRLTAALLSNGGAKLFATTSDAKIKTNLTKAGFTEKGNTWKGSRQDDISLWIKE